MGYLLLFYSNLISSSILLGLILIVHFVHYKSFYFISDKEFVDFHSFHTRSISYLVIPLMIIVFVGAAFLHIRSTKVRRQTELFEDTLLDNFHADVKAKYGDH